MKQVNIIIKTGDKPRRDAVIAWLCEHVGDHEPSYAADVNLQGKGWMLRFSDFAPDGSIYHACIDDATKAFEFSLRFA